MGQKRGLSTVIVSVLLILISVVAVSIFAVLVNQLLTNSLEEVDTSLFNTRFSISNVYANVSAGKLQFMSTKETGDSNLSLVKIIVSGGGKSLMYTLSGNIGVLEKKTYGLNTVGLNVIESIKIVPFNLKGKAGPENVYQIKEGNFRAPGSWTSVFLNPGEEVECVDADGDGYNVTVGCGPLDCDDGDANVNPSKIEDCATAKDDNCNGQTNEGCPGVECVNGATRECLSGSNVGECNKGTETCVSEVWNGICSGAVTPVIEICSNGKDENCDGTNDEGCGGGSTVWVSPIGIPAPEFGIEEDASMYHLEAGETCATHPNKCYYFGASFEAYKDAGNGPYTHYVDNSVACSDATNGTAANPRCKLPTVLSPGSVVEMHGFLYTLGPGIVTWEGTVSRPIFIRGIGMPRYEKQMTIYSDNVNYYGGRYVIIEGFDLRSFYVSSPNAHHIALRNSRISSGKITPTTGVQITGQITDYSHDIVIYNNNMSVNGDWMAPLDNDRHGMKVLNSQRVWVADNEMSFNEGNGIQLGDSGSGNANIRYVYIGRNKVHHNKQDGLWTKQASDVIFSENIAYENKASGGEDGAGIGFQYGPDRVWILFNHINHSAFGITSGSNSGGTGAGIYIIGNLIHDIYNRTGRYMFGTTSSAILLQGGTERYVIGNTIHNVSDGINLPTNGGIFRVENNIISNISSPTGNHIFIANPTPATPVIYHLGDNLFYQSSGIIKIKNASEVYTSLKISADNLIGDPKFVNPLLKNFHIQSSSSAIDSGSLSAVYDTFQTLYGIDIKKDIEGRARNGEWDIGAYEYAA